MNTLRLFFAIEISSAAQTQIAERVQAIRSPQANVRDIRWTATCNLHITLKFLGETPIESLQAIMDAVAPVFHDQTPIPCRITRCDVFGRSKPRNRRQGPPTVIHLEVEDGGSLTVLAGKLDAALETLGYKRERRAYVPHVTLARTHSPDAISPILKWFADQPLDVPFMAHTVILFGSELRRDGPVYTPVSRYDLGGSGECSAESSAISS